MSDTDLQLLERYTQQHAEDAFAELVRRYLNLVFSAALRQVRSPQLAEEVAQSAFTDLARQVHRLAPDTVLSAWLYQVTRRTAIDVVRREARRQHREQVACELNAMNTTASDWSHIEPLLDEAMQALEETDRTAVLLRYFENKSLREVGQALGASEEAARKRISRAVDRLREFFARQGVTVGASGLVALVSANAVQAAPAGLAATISTAAALAGTTLAAVAAATTTKAIIMTALQKTLVTATVVAAVGTGVYQARQAARLRDQVQTLRQQQAPLAQQIQQLQRERDDARSQLAAAAKPALRLPAPPIQLTAPAATPPEELRTTNLFERFPDGVRLTAKQVESYLKAHGRDAASLLAAYRTTGDRTLLAEAMQKYPHDPLVTLEAAYSKDASPEAQRQWLEAFKHAAPDNALPHYLLARNYFNAGQNDQAIQELLAAAGKSQTEDFFVNRMSDNEEAYLAAGYSPAEAKAISLQQLELMPNRGDLKQLAYDLVELAKSYQRAGDDASAQSALQLTAQLGQRGQSPSPGQIAIDQFLGFAIETLALNAMIPSSPYGDGGQTVRDRLNQIAKQKAALKELVVQSDVFLKTLPDQDWINYADRLKTFGEVAAMRWILGKYGPK